MSLCKYVDVFYGNFESDLPEPNETASNWFFLKAQAGNTSPAATRPFGMVSACSYTGGYPSGYGPYLPNSFARPARLLDPENMTALGFSHFHQSGTGYIGDFYNYSIITPVNGKEHNRFLRFHISNEKATPGYYSCDLGNVSCETTVTDNGAIYSFKFNNDKENTIVFDPILNGIFKDLDTPYKKFGGIKYLSCAEKNGAISGVFFNNDVVLHTAIKCDNVISS